MHRTDLKLVLDCVIFDLQSTGGISRYWRNLISGLLERGDCDLHLGIDPSTRNGFGRSVIMKAGNAATATIHPVRTGRFSRYRSPVLPVATLMGSVFHSSYYRLHGGSPANVTTVHDFTYERFPRGLPTWIHAWQKNRAIRQCKEVICVSEATRNDLLEYLPDVDPARVHVIHHGIERAFTPKQTPVDLYADPYVLFVGDRSGYKNFRNVVLALANLQDLRLLIAGKPLSAAERELVFQTLPDRFATVTPNDDEALADLYRNAFALAYPSRHEGFGMPVLEAMACGCPVVAANASSIPEVAGNAALMCADPSREALTAALTQLWSTGLRADLVTRGLARARNFSWENSIDKHLAVYAKAHQ